MVGAGWVMWGLAACIHPARAATVAIREPVMETRLAGYRVYRRADGGGEWTRLDADLVRVAAYGDATVAAGHKYAYRVTAVNDAGSESVPSGDVTETASAL